MFKYMEKSGTLSKDEGFLEMALTRSRKSTCLRRHFGAVIVKEGCEISTGYNGSARDAPNCVDIGYCLKDKYKMKPGMAYELCRAGPLHAEVNAIINAARHYGGTVGATIYIAGEYAPESGKSSLSDAYPCKSCQKVIINAGIEKVIVRKKDGGIKTFNVYDWITYARLHSDDGDIKGFY